MAPRRFGRGVGWLRSAGFEVRVGTQAYARGYAAGPAADRASELNEAIRDRSVRAIVTSIGGFNANGVLPYLDYAGFSRDPKVLIGYSDITALLLAMYARSGVVTFHGPTLMPELAEFPVPFEYSLTSMRAAVMTPRPLGQLCPAAEYTEEFTPWDSQDDRARRMRAARGWSWLAAGAGTGRLVGGNLETVCALAGTPYLPCTSGAVLFWETCADSLALVERSLCQLDASQVTANLAGMIVGRTFRAGEDFELGVQAMVRERYGARGFPIVAEVDIGHTDPMLTLPIGVEARLDAGQGLIDVVGAGVR